MVQLIILKVWYYWPFFSVPKNAVLVFDGGGAGIVRYRGVVVATGRGNCWLRRTKKVTQGFIYMGRLMSKGRRPESGQETKDSEIPSKGKEARGWQRESQSSVLTWIRGQWATKSPRICLQVDYKSKGLAWESQYLNQWKVMYYYECTWVCLTVTLCYR